MKYNIKTSEELTLMRKAGAILQEVQNALKEQIAAGVSLLELDQIAEDLIRSAGAQGSFKGYQGFPGTLCTMLNSEVVHGIPDKRTLKNGDLLSVDCGVIWKGYHADAAFSVIVGGPRAHPKRAQFSDCVYEALQQGCKAAKAGNTLGDIGHAIEQTIKKGRYKLCKEYTGHGLGTTLHEDPHVFNYGNPGEGDRLISGMTLAIEPIVASGNPACKVLSDDWTVVTVDGQDACQWEHCGVVTPDGLEIFA